MDAASSCSTAKLSNLPPELVTKILLQSVTEPPTCAFTVFCPEWNLCERKHSALETILRSTRVDTYTLPSRPGEKGHMTTTFAHGPDDHIHVPLMLDPRDINDGVLLGFYYREMVREWASESMIVVGQELTHIGSRGREMSQDEVDGIVLLREPRSLGLLPFVDDFSLDEVGDGEMVGPAVAGKPRNVTVCATDGREKDTLPPVRCFTSAPSYERGEGGKKEPKHLFQRIRHLVLNTVPALAVSEPWDVGTLPAATSHTLFPNMEMVRERLCFERKANFCLRWKALERLESLFLDLRGLSFLHKPFLDLDEVGELALSLQGMGLKLLVIAGLRSWRCYPGPRVAEITDVEGGRWDPQWKVWIDERIGSVNWWWTFAGALQPGGRLILVDKQNGGSELKLGRSESLTEVLDS
ncbi:hypothetical protein MMYC01_202338 [Madurella mycetomatis]|uniref:Uncharacterized protein n=1 Tax=Madurella mycetomatis TaxID=100816 RepID=A0A175WED5_9PEZI|nr:hypothetical protein MMYC01_202338 [Madurella mycetomatis]